jgi:hypothetical protein
MVQHLELLLSLRKINNNGVMDELYFDPRAKAVASRLCDDMSPLSPCNSVNTVQQLHIQHVLTEYGQYNR